jgi:hypothetical protein
MLRDQSLQLVWLNPAQLGALGLADRVYAEFKENCMCSVRVELSRQRVLGDPKLEQLRTRFVERRKGRELAL